MTWTRLDDAHTESTEWEYVSYESRWHYLCLVQLCSRGKRWDGVIPYNRALGCSDVPDPALCLEELESISRVTRNVRTDVPKNSSQNGSCFVTVTVTRIDEHIPPPSVRDGAERAKERMKRKRAHDKGNHSFCDAEKCPDAQGVTRTVPKNPRTGQDRTAVRGEHYETKTESQTANDATCVVCHQPMLIVEKGQRTHPSCEYAGGPVEWNSELERVS